MRKPRYGRVWVSALIAAAMSVAVVSPAGAETPQESAMSNAAPAATCYGDYCSGQNPETTGCSSDADTVVHARIPGTWTNIELRWSPSCKTKWARVPASWGTSLPNNLRAYQCATGYQQVGIVDSNSNFAWTAMIYSPNLTVMAQWIGPPGSTGTSCW